MRQPHSFPSNLRKVVEITKYNNFINPTNLIGSRPPTVSMMDLVKVSPHITGRIFEKIWFTTCNVANRRNGFLLMTLAVNAFEHNMQEVLKVYASL